MFDGPIRDHASWTPRAVAVLTPSRTITYGQFNADIDRFGAALAQLQDLRQAPVVSVCVDDPYLTYVLTAALARLGIASSPFDDPGAALRLTQDRPGAGTAGPGPRRVILTQDWIEQVAAAPPTPLPVLDLDPEAVGRVMLSSGTTATPRRVAFTWRRLQAVNLANLSSRGSGLHGTWVPLTTIESIQGLSLAISAWCQGAAITGGVGPAELPAILETRPPGLIGCTPVLLRTLLGVLPPHFVPRPGWRISVGGSRLSVALAREARLRLTPDVRVNYGATECTLSAQGLAAGLEEDPGLVGAPLAGARIEIIDDDGHPVADGEVGEIRIRGDRVGSGYLNDPEATAQRFRDGWFYTRDIGRRLPDGRLALEGRVDDRMNLGGRKFMPAVLEDAAAACPGVLDVAAFAVPGNGGLDECWLAVVTEPDFDRETLAVHLSHYPGLPPKRFAWTDEIPRNAMGKVERAKLRDALLASLAKD